MDKISDIFGSMVFNDAVMRERLPKETYRQVQATMEKGKRLDDDAARIVANAMKDWACLLYTSYHRAKNVRDLIHVPGPLSMF